MVKFYHVLAFDFRLASPVAPSVGFYLGKTSDLVFKTEPDKTIDMDDGTTEVGSEKLSVSFSLLGKVMDTPQIKELWLLPVSGDYLSDNPEIIRIFIEDGAYTLDAKSGEFGKINFMAVQRYPVESPQYSILPYYFDDYFMPLLGLTGDLEYGDMAITDDAYNVLVGFTPSDDLIEGAFCAVFLPSYSEYIIKCGDDNYAGLDATQSQGLLRLQLELG